MILEQICQHTTPSHQMQQNAIDFVPNCRFAKDRLTAKDLLLLNIVQLHTMSSLSLRDVREEMRNETNIIWCNITQQPIYIGGFHFSMFAIFLFRTCGRKEVQTNIKDSWLSNETFSIGYTMGFIGPRYTWVRSMGPDVSNSNSFCGFNWCDSLRIFRSFK